jgi:hypothetical protein
MHEHSFVISGGKNNDSTAFFLTLDYQGYDTLRSISWFLEFFFSFFISDNNYAFNRVNILKIMLKSSG